MIYWDIAVRVRQKKLLVEWKKYLAKIEWGVSDSRNQRKNWKNWLTSNDDPWYNYLNFCCCFQQVKFTANLGQEPLESNTQAVNLDKNRNNRRPNSRAKSRELFCPAHPEQRISGNGRKYFLHLVKSEDRWSCRCRSRKNKWLETFS